MKLSKGKEEKLELKIADIEHTANIDMVSIIEKCKSLKSYGGNADELKKFMDGYRDKRKSFNVGVCQCLLGCEIMPKNGKVYITNFNQYLPNVQQLERIKVAINTVLSLETGDIESKNTEDDDMKIINKRPIDVNRAKPSTVEDYVVGEDNLGGILGTNLDMNDFEYISSLGASLRLRRNKMRVLAGISTLAVLGGAVLAGEVISNNRKKSGCKSSENQPRLDNTEQPTLPEVTTVEIPDNDVPEVDNTVPSFATVDIPEVPDVTIVDNSDVPNVKIENVDVPVDVPNVSSDVEKAKLEQVKTTEEIASVNDEEFVVE